MDNNILKQFTKQGFSSRKIANLLKISQTTVRYWLSKYNLTTKGTNCKVCNKILTKRQSSFCSAKCKGKFHQTPENNANSYLKQKERAFVRKKQLVDSKGGCCEICGYKKNYSALQFHHLDPSKKDHNLDSRKLSNATWEWCLEEATKCKLLCANCHAETHYPQFKM